jgi:hypothetical protein
MANAWITWNHCTTAHWGDPDEGETCSLACGRKIEVEYARIEIAAGWSDTFKAFSSPVGVRRCRQCLAHIASASVGYDELDAVAHILQVLR